MSETLRRNRVKYPHVILALALWSLFFLFNWQDLLIHSSIRLMLSYGIFIAPGTLLSALIYRKNRYSVNLFRDIPVGFAISISFVSLVGFTSILAGFSFEFVKASFSLFSLLVFLYVAFICPPFNLKISQLKHIFRTEKTLSYLVIIINIIAFILFLFLVLQKNTLNSGSVSTFGNFAGYMDNYLYHAYVMDFIDAEQLSFGEKIFNSGHLPANRLWLQTWPMSQAILIDMADTNILSIYFYQQLIILCIGYLGVWGLARTLGLDHTYSALAATLQFVIMLSLQFEYQPGGLVIFRINEDKFFYIFVLAPITFLTLLLFASHRNWRSYMSYLAIVISSILIHPAAPMVLAIIISIFLLFNFLKGEKNWRFAFQILIPWFLLGSVLIVLRLLNTDIASLSTPSAIDQMSPELYERNMYRMNIIQGTPFIGVSSNIWFDMPFLLYYIISVFCLWIFRNKDVIVKFLLAQIVLHLLLIIPYTGWLLGILLTPYQLWRYMGYAPLGITFAFGLYGILKYFQSNALKTLLLTVFSFGVIAYVVIFGGIRNQDIDSVLRGLSSGSISPRETRFEALSALGDFLDEHIDDNELPALVLAYNSHLSNQIPTISSKAIPYFFRGISSMARQATLSEEEAQERVEVYRAVFAENTPISTRIELIQYIQPDYLLILSDLQYLISDLDPFLTQIGEFDGLILYDISNYSE
ncbi:MAG: hypothetical protein ACFE0Q_01410 [Anaerolineae bacterium]